MTVLATPERLLLRDAATVGGEGLRLGGDERLARRALREQIARLEAELGAQAADAQPRYRSFAEMIRATTAAGEARTAPAAPSMARPARPRLLSLGELEAERDRLAASLRERRAAIALTADRQDEARRLREEILRDPAAHAGVRVSNADIGEPGCHDWHVRPRFGVLGMLMRWWRVKISSGCP
jgi:hypothetical protein